MKNIFVSRNVILIVISLFCGTFLTYAQIAQPQLDSAYGAMWSPDGRTLAISGRSGLWLYNLLTGNLESISQGVAFNGWTTDSRIFTGFGFFNPVTRLVEGQFTLQRPQYTFSTNIGLSRDAKTLAVLEGDYLDSIAVYNTVNGELIRRINTNNPNAGPQIAWSPDDSRFAMLKPNQPSVLLIPNTDTPRITEYSIANSPSYKSGQFPINIKWSPSGKFLAIGATPSTVFLLDVQSGKFVGNLEGQSPVGLAWSPDETILAVTNGIGTLTLFDVKTRTMIEQYHTSGYNKQIEFSPLGGQLAVANDFTVLAQNGTQSPQVTQQLGVYVRSIGTENAVQLFVPAASPEKLQAITKACGVQPSVQQSLTAQITSNKLQDFTTQVSALTDAQIPPGCKADLLAVAEALMAQGQ
jgi:WD40 repeat protein